MDTNGKKKFKLVDSNLKLSKTTRWSILFLFLAIVGIGIGYGLGFLSGDWATNPNSRQAININLPKPHPQSNHRKETPNNNIIKKGPNKNRVTNNHIALPNSSLTKKTKTRPKLKEETAKNLTKNINSFDEKEVKLTPKIAIVFDDLGIDLFRTKKIMELRGPLSLSFITYAPKLKEQTKNAQRAGHELWMHMPMEPRSNNIDPGPNVLLTGLPRKELEAAIQWNLTQFSGYVGINNHMGSRFTADLESIRIFMRELKKHNLIFLDSKTSSHSVARKAAIEANVPFIVRNIFIDHIDETKEIKKMLVQVEKLAHKTGYAVAIGHPKDNTLREIKPWLNTLESKDLQLVPLSKLVKYP